MTTIGFVGAGLIGWAHAVGIQAMIDAGHVDAAFGAVYDVDAGSAESFGAVTGAAAVGSVAEVVERCDVVWVCTPTAAHRGAVELAAEAGRAVFCEKPLAVDAAGAQAMADIVARAGVPAQVGLVLRFSPVLRALRGLLDSGELGEPMAVVLRDDQYFPVQGTYGSSWRADPVQAGGGCLIEHSIHDVDILRVCFGEVARVSCRTADFSGHPGVEDLAVVSLEFASGAVGEIVSVWHDILSRGSTRRIEVFCRRGMAWLEQEYLGPLHVQTSDASTALPCVWPGWVAALDVGDGEVGLAIRSYVEADRSFLDAVTGGSAPDPPFAEAVAAHRMVESAYRSSAAGGAPVALEQTGVVPPT